MMLLILVSFFILGLLVGSFLNVVVFRLERQEDFIKGRSRCLSCNTPLSWFDNIPLISFVWLRGRCRHCQVKLSYQYPLVELLTGGLFALVMAPLGWYAFGSWQQVIFIIWALTTVCFGVLIVVYDLKHKEIPVVFLWGLGLALILFIIIQQLLGDSVLVFLPTFSSVLWGTLISGGFFFLLVFISRETWMGWGDVWIGAWAGALVGIELVQVFITLSFSLGALVGLTLLYRKEKNLKSELPFAPYLLFAALIIVIARVAWPDVLGFLSPWFFATL